MADKVTMQIHGLRELEARLKALPAEIKRGGVINRALLKGARLVRDEARRNAPVLNPFDRAVLRGLRQAGALRQAITAHLDRDMPLTAIVRVRSRGYIFGGRRDQAEGAHGNPNYWWLVEFGTSKKPARPFIRRAFEARKEQAALAIKQGLLEELDKAARDPAGYAASQRRRRR